VDPVAFEPYAWLKWDFLASVMSHSDRSTAIQANIRLAEYVCGR
jgi:hypothetical protein